MDSAVHWINHYELSHLLNRDRGGGVGAGRAKALPLFLFG